jgi:hypothetical protein
MNVVNVTDMVSYQEIVTVKDTRWTVTINAVVQLKLMSVESVTDMEFQKETVIVITTNLIVNSHVEVTLLLTDAVYAMAQEL